MVEVAWARRHAGCVIYMYICTWQGFPIMYSSPRCWLPSIAVTLLSSSSKSTKLTVRSSLLRNSQDCRPSTWIISMMFTNLQFIFIQGQTLWRRLNHENNTRFFGNNEEEDLDGTFLEECSPILFVSVEVLGGVI